MSALGRTARGAFLAPAAWPARPRRGERMMPALAPGERLLWRGGPDWRAVACHVFHIRAVALYFAALTLLDMAITRWHEGGGRAVARAAAPTLLIGGGCVLILVALAWATQRTTLYVLTDRRIILLFGLALPATLVIPLHRVAAMSVRVRADHGGDICLRLRPGEPPGYAKLWPHVRPWRVLAPQPMLRDIPRLAMVAPLLCEALADAAWAPRDANPPRHGSATQPTSLRDAGAP